MFKSGYIAIVGRPNTGKSTLLNSLLGSEISIVTPKAQTTREKILGILTEDQGQIIFMDTPGIHRAKEGGLNEFMVREAQEAIESPSLIWYLVDPYSTAEVEAPVLELLRNTQAPIILLMNKLDLAERTRHSTLGLESLEAAVIQAAKKLEIEFAEVRRISGLIGAGVPELLKESWNHLSEGPAYYPDPEQISDRPIRFFVAEKIREQLLHLLGDELPYSCAIEIRQFDENSQPPRIEATIHVERDSQKGMVIGKGGQKIKEIGQAARAEIEKFLEKKIFLGLKVEVLKNWSRNPDQLRKLGYQLPLPQKGRASGRGQGNTKGNAKGKGKVVP